MPHSSSASLVLTLSTACKTPLPRYFVLSPSRSSQASWIPVLAPLGTAARPKRAVGQFHVDLDGRIAAAVEDLSGTNVYNG